MHYLDRVHIVSDDDQLSLLVLHQSCNCVHTFGTKHKPNYNCSMYFDNTVLCWLMLRVKKLYKTTCLVSGEEIQDIIASKLCFTELVLKPVLQSISM